MSYLHNKLEKTTYNYKVISDVSASFGFDIASLKTSYLLLPSDNSSSDAAITLMLKAAYEVSEKLIRRPIIRKTLSCNLDVFPYSPIEINRPDVQSISSIVYRKDGVETTFPSSDYYLVNESKYSLIDTEENKEWPGDADRRKQAITITFTSGQWATEASLPNDIRMAVIQIACKYFEMRGDCSDWTATNEGLKYSLQTAIPHTAKLLLQKYVVPLSSSRTTYRVSDIGTDLFGTPSNWYEF